LYNHFADILWFGECAFAAKIRSGEMISALAIGLKPGDEAIVPAYTFVASCSALIFLGLVPRGGETSNPANRGAKQ
jgi:hypothetical protein